MKKNYLYTLVGIGFGLLFFACEMRDELRNSTESDSTGILLLDLAVETRSESSAEAPDVKDFYIQITDKDEAIVKEIPVYGQLTSEDREIELPIGEYKVKAASYAGEIEEATLDKPYFAGEQLIKINDKEQQKLSVVCTLQSVEVELIYNEEFLEKVEPDFSVLLTNGKGILLLENEGSRVYSGESVSTRNGSTQRAYFKESDAIQITVRATTKEGNFISNTSSFRNLNNTASGGDVFQVVIKVEEKTDPVDPVDPPIDPPGPVDPPIDPPGPVDPPVDPEPGSGNFEIVIDVTWNGKEIQVEIPRPGEEGGGEDPDPGPGPEPVPDNEPVITGAEEYLFHLIPSGFFYEVTDPRPVVVSMDVPKGLKHLYVDIESTSEGFMQDPGLALITNFDLVNPTPEQLEALIALNLLDSEERIEGAINFVFDITPFVDLLAVFEPNTHYFHLRVVDLDGQEAKETLTIDMQLAN